MRGRLLILAVLAAAAGAAAVALTLLIAGERGHAERRLVAGGSADRRLAPDLAIVRLGATARADTARDALDETSAELRAVVAAVRRIGAEEIRSEPARLARAPAEPGDGAPMTRPFVARQAVTVRIRRLGETGRIIDAAVAAGATDVAGPRLALDDPRAAERRVAADAVADAREKARAMAEAAGLRVASIVRITDRPAGAPAATGRDAAEAAPPVAPGTIPVRARVTVTFAVEPA